MGITLYAAEKPLNADAILRKSLATGKPIPHATANLMIQQQRERVARDGIDFLMTWGKQVPEKIIRDANPESAKIARQHNQNLQSQLDAHQPK